MSTRAPGPGVCPYTPFDDTLVDKLRAAVGAGAVHCDAESMERHSRDETEDLRFPPDVVVEASCREHVQEVLRFALEHRVPVTPSGARTGLSGGALCVHGGIALSLTSMTQIKEIDEHNFMAVVESGVITETLHDAVEALGLFYPPDPASRGSCTIGGNIAENAGGPRALKYGVTEDWVRGLEGVLVGGSVCRFGGKRLKDVTGYNLVKLLVGSEGTLAVVTEATLKLTALPRCFRTALVPFMTVAEAAKTVPAAFRAGLQPCAMEFMERAALEAVDLQLGTRTARGDGQAYLLVELDGNDEAVLDADLERLANLCLENGAIDVWLADGPAKRRELWRGRRAMGEAVKRLCTYREEDTVVPRAAIPEAIRRVRAVVDRFGVDAICYGHAGDGNIHVNVLRRDMALARWRELSPQISRAIFTEILALGGTISGEHGIGWIQQSNMDLAFAPHELDLQRRIKTAFDPHNLLNPSKLFGN